MARAENIRRKQGDTYPIEATILDSSGSAYDLTGVTEVKLGVDQRDALVVSDTPDLVVTGSVTDAVNGLVEFPLSAPDAALAVGTYNAEIQMLDGAFIITTESFKYEVVGQIVY